jgi:DNA-binding SARP family transcriptional activator/Flp pilus assembly protein TadD
LNGESGPGAELNVLGTLALTDASGRSLDRILAQPKRLALLIYLVAAVPGGSHRRDPLRAMFWPDLERDHATRALRQALYFLRSHLPAGSLTSSASGDIGIARHSIACDAVRFGSLLDHGREEEALACYGGDLLPGFHLWGESDFDRWVDVERQRLRRRACRASWFLAQRRLEDGDAAGAAAWARAAAAHAPLDERVQADTATLLARTSGRTAAVQSIERAGRHRADAGLATSAVLEALAIEIAADRPPELPRDVRAPAGQPAPAHLLRLATTPSRTAGPSAPQMNMDAYHCYLRGRHFSRQRTPAAMLEAVAHFHAALRIDSRLAVAHAGLAEVWTVLPVYSAYPPAEAYTRARQHALKAIALDDTLADAHASLAMVTVCFEWEWSKAETHIRHALELDPGASHVWVLYALYLLTPAGRFDEAIRAAEHARQLAPASPAENAYLAMVCYHARLYDRAIGEARLTLELNDRFPLAWWALGMAQEQSDDAAGAVSSLERAADLTGGSPLMLAQLGRAYARAGRRPEAEAILARLKAPDGDGGPTPYFTASIHAALGNVTLAMDWLEHAYRQRVPHTVFLAVAPEMDALRGERRFRALIQRMALHEGEFHGVGAAVPRRS